jgi:hypothetical protein
VFVILLDGQEAASSTVSSTVLSGVEAGVAHEVQVVLRSETGESLGQSLIYHTPVDPPETGEPLPATPPAPTLKAVDRRTVTLAWSPTVASDVIGLDLARDGRVIARVATRGEFTDDMTTMTSSRSYRLRTVTRDDRKSVWGPDRRVSLPPDTVKPGAVIDVMAADADGGGVRVSWTADPASDDVLSFLIYRDGTYLGTATQSPYIDTSLSDDLLHRYTVVAVDRAGNSSAISAASEYRARPIIPAVPSVPEVFLVQRLQEASYPLEMSAAKHLSYGVEVTWEPQVGEASRTHAIGGYRVYRNDTLVAEIPLAVLLPSIPFRMDYGRLLSREKLLLRGNAYYDFKRCRNVWVDEQLPQPGAEVRYAITAVGRSGGESPRTAAVAPTMPTAVAPRRPEILRVRPLSRRSVAIEVNAWPLLRADPYHNQDYPVQHGPGALGWPSERIDVLPLLPHRTLTRDGAPVTRNLLDDRRHGRLLTSDLFGGGDLAWSGNVYAYQSSVMQALMRDPADTFVGSGAQSWNQGSYAEVDLFVEVDGLRRPVSRRIVPGWNLDGRPCRIQEIVLDDLAPSSRYVVAIVARTPAGHESRSAPWSLATFDPATDGFDFVDVPRLVGPTAPYPNSYAVTARAITTHGNDLGITYAWRHLTETASFLPNNTANARDAVMTRQSNLWSSTTAWWTKVQTIRCYITYQGRTKYMDVDVRFDLPTIAFDPASFPIFPGPKPVSP